MGLLVTELALADFRSFERLGVALSPGVTVFVGPNAAGKTNTVEALQLLTSGQSFRRPTPSPSVRRDEIDDFGRQANRGYANVLAAYLRSVEQRNRLLKDEFPDEGLIEAWDSSVSLGGATLLHARLRLFSRLADRVSEVYGRVSGGEELVCSYSSTLGEGVEGLTRDELRDLFYERLRAGRSDDLRRRQTCVGPHRDDVSFSIEGRDARSFGSQGQQRTVALAVKMAEVGLAEELLGSRPLLLLDDVMSELDESRREAVMSYVREGIQTVVTTTNLGYFSAELLDVAEVIRFGS